MSSAKKFGKEIFGKDIQRKRKAKAVAQVKATANKPQATPTYRASTSRSSAGRLSPEPGTYGSGNACPATPAGTPLPAASLTAATTVSATAVSATTGSCPTIGAPHPEHTRAVTATSAAHSRHLICTHPAADAQSDTTP